MEDEEDIVVKYRIRGETEWQVKKEAVMVLGKTQWGVRLKLCKQGDGHNYYSLHVGLLTKGRMARAQIKCHRDGEEKNDWMQEYTFGHLQNVLINPCLMKIDNREKITFIVEIKLLWEKEKPFELDKEIFFPNADFGLLIDDRKLMVDKEYMKRKAPLLGYMFENEEENEKEKKEYDLSGQNITFQDLVDCFGALQHHWPFEAPRLIELIPIARKLGFDIWGKPLNREFSQLINRSEPVKIEPLEDEPAETFDFNEPIMWSIEDVSKLTSSTVASNQHVLLTSTNRKRNCLCFVYNNEYFGTEYLSFGFQMTKNSDPTPSTSSDSNVPAEGSEAPEASEMPEAEDADVVAPESAESAEPADSAEPTQSAEPGEPAETSESPESPDISLEIPESPQSPEPQPDVFPDYFDITISIQTADGSLVCCDKIRRVCDEDYIIVGSPVFQRLENIQKYISEDDKLTVEINWTESADDQNDDTYTLPGVTDCNIICEHVSLKANKEFLAHHSDYFRALFFGKFREARQSCIDLGSEEFSTFKSALDMIYNRRLNLSEKDIEEYLYFARRLLFNTITKGIEFQLWNSTMDVSDKKWLAEEYLLDDLVVKCQMDIKEEQLRNQRASRKRARPADFTDEPPQAPPQPIPSELLPFPEFALPEQLSS